MNCVKCGANLDINDKFCPNCGNLVQEKTNNQMENGSNTFSYERSENKQANYNYQPQTEQMNYNNQQNIRTNSYGQETKNYGRTTT